MSIAYLLTVIDAIYTFMRSVVDFVAYEVPAWAVDLLRSAGDALNDLMALLTLNFWNAGTFSESWHDFCDLLAEHPLGIAVFLAAGALLIVVVVLRILKTLWDAVPIL